MPSSPPSLRYEIDAKLDAEAIDRLFDDVMILVDDERTRTNRLDLLKKVADLFQWFADFSKISL